MAEAHLIRIGDAELGTTSTEHVAKFQSLRGWHGLPPMRGGLDPIPGGSGSFMPVAPVRSERPITVTGYVHLSDHETVTRAIDDLSNLLAPGSHLKMSVLDTGIWWSRDVVVDQFDPEDARGTGFARFTIDLTAPDPVRYRDPVTLGPAGLPVRDGGLVLPAAFPWDFGTSVRPAVTVVNDGTVPVLPMVTVRGSADSLAVHGGPRRIEFGPFNGELVIDNRARRAWLNGGDVTRQLVRRDWQAVPAGVSQEFFFDTVGASPDTTMTVEYRIGAW